MSIVSVNFADGVGFYKDNKEIAFYNYFLDTISYSLNNNDMPTLISFGENMILLNRIQKIREERLANKWEREYE